MEQSKKNDFQILQSANQEMLAYFNKQFLNQLADIQDLKTQVFELDIKIDELEKTKDIYAFKTTSRKSVFSPIANTGLDTERGQIINDSISNYSDIRETLTAKIHNMDADLNRLKKRIALLNDAEDALKRLTDPEAVSSINNDSDFEFVEENDVKEISTHGYNILMQDAFEKTFLSTLLNKNVKENLISINHKLEMLSYLLSTDPSRAKLTIQEILMSSSKALGSLDDFNNKLTRAINQEESLQNTINAYIVDQNKAHPSVKINAHIECTDYEIDLHPVFTINLLKLLDIFFDNIYKHADASEIAFNISLTPNVIDVSIDDNGVGIKNDYLDDTPWYSSLHHAHEIIYLLNGSLSINGDLLSGTKVRFHFPIRK